MAGIYIVGRLSKSLVGLVVLVGLLGFAPGFVATAQAQDKSKSDKATAKKVLEGIRDGNKAFEAEDYEVAFEKYKQAYELYPDPAILVRLGKTAEKLGKNRAAAGYFREFTRLMPDDPASEKLAQRADELEADLSIVVSVTSEPSGAAIYIAGSNGEIVGTTPADIELSPGEHTLYLKREGFETATEKINVENKQGQTVSATLSRAMIAESDSPSVEPSGTSASESDDTSVEPLQNDESTVQVIGWASLGVGVAALATSGMFLSLKNNAEDDVHNYDKRAPGASRDEIQELKDNAHSHYDAALVTGIAGGIFAAAGAGLLGYHYLTPENDDDVALNVGAGFDTESAWFGLNGRF